MPRFLLKARKLADRRTFQGLEISVETAAGQHRHWHDPHTGRGGSTEMLHDYGYIRGSQGADGDHVDCYVGPHADATHAYVVDQRKAPHFQELDEQKVMLGFLTPEDARDAYLKHYDSPLFFGGLRMVPMEDFKRQVLATCSHQPLVMSSPRGDLSKAGPFIGPRGGKWADAKHTIPWKEGTLGNERATVKKLTDRDFLVSGTSVDAGGRVRIVPSTTRKDYNKPGKVNGHYVLWEFNKPGERGRSWSSKVMESGEATKFAESKIRALVSEIDKISAATGGDYPAWMRGNLGIERKDMPQIRSFLRDKFLDTLRAKGVGVKSEQVRADSLNATQRNIHADILDRTKGGHDGTGGRVDAEKPIMVSRDGYILDGHHRWGAIVSTKPTEKMNAVRIDLPIRDLLNEARGFDHVQFEKGESRIIFKGSYNYHKYKRRWRGPDGKWQYEYGEDVQVPLHRKPDVPDGYDDLHGSKPIKRGMNIDQVEDAIRHEPVEHMCIFGPDGEQLARARGEKHSVDFTGDAVRLIRENGKVVLTHNHPSGSCFSNEDLWSAIANNMAEMRAVTPVGTFVLKRPDGGWFGNGEDFRHVVEALDSWAGIPVGTLISTHIAKLIGSLGSYIENARVAQDRWMVSRGRDPGAPSNKEENDAWEKHCREARHEYINKRFSNPPPNFGDRLGDSIKKWKVELIPRGESSERRGDAAIGSRAGQRSAARVRPKAVARAPEQLALFRSHRMVFRVASPLLKGSGHKYIKRESTGDPKRPWRYYYAESSVARDVHEGSHVRLGDQVAEVVSVAAGGKIVLKLGGEVLAVTPKQWSDLLSKHYGEKYLGWAEKRAAQSVNAVLRHVPRQLLTDLEGTDAQRLAQLKVRAPEVYAKLQASFARSGVSPFRAKQVLSTVLSRRGWKPEARAAVIGLVLENKDKGYRQVISGAENLAGGAQVEVAHVAAVTELRNPAGQSFSASVAQVGKQAEAELAALSAALSKARNGKPADLAAVLTTALSSKSMAKLGLLVKAFPGIKDKVVEPARKALLAVPAAAPRPAPTRDGARGVVYIADENGAPKPLDIQYKLVEAGEAIASHKPDTFAKRSDYPEGIQERAYHRDKAEQAKVMRNAQKMNPAFVVNTNPDAVNGPPIMDSNGVVLGGNSRTMSLQRAYLEHPEQATAMKQYLADHAHEVGLRSSDVNAMKNPILVRVMAPKSTEEQKLLVRQMNESFTQGMDPRTMQVALGRKLDDAALESLGADMEPGETLNAFLATSRADGFVNSLMRAGVIDQRNASQYLMKGTRTLNEDGRTMVSRILVGRMVGDADLLSNTGSRMIENIARSVPLMAQARQYGDGYDMSSDLRVALEAYNGLQYRVSQGHRDPLSPTMTDREFQGLFRQTELFGGGDENPVTKNPRAHALLEVLIRQNGPAKMASVFTRYAEQAKANPEGQGGLFGASKSPTEIFQEVIAPPKSAGPAPKFYPKPVAA